MQGNARSFTDDVQASITIKCNSSSRMHSDFICAYHLDASTFIHHLNRSCALVSAISEHSYTYDHHMYTCTAINQYHKMRQEA